jgi:sugar/nucleoside kinase (ribokinase family)
MSAAGRGRVVCLGEALVDLVCEQPVVSLGDAPGFVPRVGGSLANIAVVAARFGARVEMLGGAGDDEWGRWLSLRIAAEGVDVSRFVLAPGVGTSHAFVAVSPSGEPEFAFYGDSDRPAAHAAADLDPALAGEPGALVLGSDTLLSESEREVTLRAAELGRERGWAVLCDPNLRPGRWAAEDQMMEAVGALLEVASVVKCNAGEARALTGDDDPAGAARALLARGPSLAVLTRGRQGALLAAAGRLTEVDAPEAPVIVDATGAGDCVSGVLAAALAAGADGAALERVLAVAMGAAMRVIGQWGALTGLPHPAEAQAALASALSPA